MARPRKLNWEQVVDYMLSNPTSTIREISTVFSCSSSTVQTIARQQNIVKKMGWVRNEG